MRISTLGQQNLEGGMYAVWRRKEKVSRQLQAVVAQTPSSVIAECGGLAAALTQ
jgi:hypothetical protein